MPVTVIASDRSTGVADVSPMTNAGTRPAASGGSRAVASRNRPRTYAAPLATSGASAVSSGGPVARRMATTSSPASAGASRPRARKPSCHCSPTQSTPPMTSTGASTWLVAPRAVTRTILARRTTISASPDRSSLARTRRGSLSATASTTTLARSPAQVSSDPALRIESWPAKHVVVSATDAQVRANTAVLVCRPSPGLACKRRIRCRATAAPPPETTARPTTTPVADPLHCRMTTTTQATRAGNSRRRSTKRSASPPTRPDALAPDGSTALTRSPWA